MARSSLDGWIPYCAAFQDRIPQQIYPGQFDHRQPHAGDNGIRFALREGAERTLRAYENSVRRRRERDVAVSVITGPAVPEGHTPPPSPAREQQRELVEQATRA
jgi:hypothetical protein